MPPCTTETRTTTNLNKTPQELTENRTIWKSDNQEVKEETFIQTGRRSRDRQPETEYARQGNGWQTRQSHICMQINQEEQLGSDTDHATQVSNMGKIKLKTFDSDKVKLKDFIITKPLLYEMLKGLI